VAVSTALEVVLEDGEAVAEFGGGLGATLIFAMYGVNGKV
jgi:hypothetical protein